MFIAVLTESTQNVLRYKERCRHIIAMMTDNPSFSAPTPALNEVSSDLNDLDECQEAVLKGGKGMVKKRNVALRRVHNKMSMIRAYVQTVANEDPDQAEVIIESAGMAVAGARAAPPAPAAGTSVKLGVNFAPGVTLSSSCCGT